jgi:hypothetical protein
VIAVIAAVALTVAAVGILAMRLVPRPQRTSPRRRLREAEREAYQAEDRIDQVVSRAVDEMLHVARFGRSESNDPSDRHRFEL